MEVSEILKELQIEDEVLNVYPYGSQVYGNDRADSDTDYIIVTKSAFLSNGAFKNNAISNKDRTIQGVLYSRTGFIDAINNYDISALECLFLPDNMSLQKKWPFKMNKFDKNEFAKKIITKSSNSWHSADKRWESGNIPMAKKGIYHALRILDFALQIKENSKIVDYTSTNELKKEILARRNFRPSMYNELRSEYYEKLRS